MSERQDVRRHDPRRLGLFAIGLALFVSSAFAEDSNNPRLPSRELWREYPVRNTFLFGKARVGDVVRATAFGNAQEVEEIKVGVSTGGSARVSSVPGTNMW
jgi:hypothetical protein